MTIDLPVESPQGNVLNYSVISISDEAENSLKLNALESDKIPVVVLKKLDNKNQYCVVSPRTSNRLRKIRGFEDFETNLSSPKKRGRPRNADRDVEMTSPTKIQRTPIKSRNKKSEKDDLENHVDNICTALKNSVKLTTPVKRSLARADFSDIELTENTPSPRKKGAQERTPDKNACKRETPKKLDSSLKNNESPLSGRRQIRTPSKFRDNNSPLKSVKINLDESFRRSVLKSSLDYENIRDSNKKTNNNRAASLRQSTQRKSTARSTPVRPSVAARKSACRSYASFYYNTDSDDDPEIERGVTSRKNVSKSESDENNSEIEMEDDKEEQQLVQAKTPSRRKQILRPRKDSTTSNASEKSEKSPERRPLREVTRTPKTHKTTNDSATSIASEKSPDRKPRREVVKTPKTPRNRKTGAITPKSVKTTPKTPKNRLKLLREGVITPSMHSRQSVVPGDSTPLMKARSQLHVSYVPTSLPCREKEYSDIHNFLTGKLDDGYGGCMYISGVPGTGKTATVTSVIDNLQNDRKIPKFDYVNVNGMRLTEPRQSYVEIWKQLTGKTVPWEQAQSLLEERFTKKKNMKPVVMLIDELDILCTKRQDVVYNLLDWPTKSKDQLIVITIANTMDLPERLLMSRVTSRLGLTRLTFQAYTHKQLMEIVAKRLTGTNSFNPDAVQLVARKVASVSGDARRALDICRRAAELAEEEGKGQIVNVMHINEALEAMITQPQVMAIRRCSRLQKLLLQATVAEIERTGVEETTFSDVFRMLVSCCALDGFKMVSSTVAQRAICELSAYRLVISDQKCSNIYQRIMLNVSVHDVYFALKK